MDQDIESTNLTVSEIDNSYEKTVRSNELNAIATVYQTILNLGTNAVDHHNQQRYIKLANFLALNTFFLSLPYIAIAFLWDRWTWLGATSAISVACLAVIGLNALGKINISRFTYLLLLNGLLFLNALIVGHTADIQHFFIVTVIFPFLIYDIRETASIVFGVWIPIVLSYAYDVTVPYFSSFNLLPTQQLFLEKLGVVTQIIMIVTAVYQLVKHSKSTESELESTNAQLMLQTAELKRSNSDLEQFAYIISHDLKTPVRNISSFMNLLVNKHSNDLSPEAKEFVGYSHVGAKRLERLIDDVLAYCRIGTNLPRPIPVNLNDVVNTIRFEMREKLSTQNAKININRELPVVNNVHASLVYHIFQNLITNGLKFNNSKAPEINIGWTNSLNYYTFTLQDNGIGISKEYSTTIFQMFKRLHNEHEYDGTGIGLAICKKIVEYYHGEIWFESEPGKGTTFHFTIRKF